jgi:peroxiredoxin
VNGFWLAVSIVQWLLLIVLYFIVFGILRYLGSIRSQIEQAAPRITRFNPGDGVADFTLPDAEGNSTSLTQFFQHGQKILLLILSTTCSTCEGIVMQVAELARRKEGLRTAGWSVVVVGYGTPDAVTRMTKEISHTEEITVLTDEQALVLRDYLVASIPVGIALDEQGRVLSQSPNPGPNWLYLTLNVLAPDHSLLPKVPMGQVRL